MCMLILRSGDHCFVSFQALSRQVRKLVPWCAHSCRLHIVFVVITICISIVNQGIVAQRLSKLGEMAISGKVLPFAHKRSKKTTQP